MNAKKPVLQISSDAAKKLQSAQDNEDNCIGIKLGISKKGCSGYSYTFDHVYNITDELHTKVPGSNLYISSEALEMLHANAVLEIRKDDLSEYLQISNEKEKSKCGCGMSFYV